MLLFGNGFFHNECNWEKFILGKDNELLENSEIKGIIYSVLADMVTDLKNDSARQDEYVQRLKEMSRTNGANEKRLDALVKLPFDAIVTTNYTYQLENRICGDLSGYTDYRWRKHIACVTCKKDETKKNVQSTLNSFNRVSSGDITQDVWHIHGEEKRKSSIVLNHNEYGRLVQGIISELKTNGDKYREYSDGIHFKSWMDYFIMGDVYILGLGLDYSEFDLWWLISRRLREKADTGSVIYYEPFDGGKKHKYTALKELGIKCKHLGCSLIEKDDKDDHKAENDQIFQKFYDLAIEDIQNKVSNKRKELQR